MSNIVRCASCDGYGWSEDEGEVADCDWCGGVGYVYAEPGGMQRRIPRADWAAAADTLERLEADRLRELGYSGAAKKPWEQDVRGGQFKPPGS